MVVTEAAESVQSASYLRDIDILSMLSLVCSIFGECVARVDHQLCHLIVVLLNDVCVPLPAMSGSRLRCFASTGSMLCPTDAFLAPVPVGGVDPRLGTGLELGVGGVIGAGVSFAVSEEDAEAEAEVVKRESLDSPRGMVLLLVSVCVWLSSYSCPCSRSCPPRA